MAEESDQLRSHVGSDPGQDHGEPELDQIHDLALVLTVSALVRTQSTDLRRESWGLNPFLQGIDHANGDHFKQLQCQQGDDTAADGSPQRLKLNQPG